MAQKWRSPEKDDCSHCELDCCVWNDIREWKEQPAESYTHTFTHISYIKQTHTVYCTFTENTNTNITMTYTNMHTHTPKADCMENR